MSRRSKQKIFADTADGKTRGFHLFSVIDDHHHACYVDRRMRQTLLLLTPRRIRLLHIAIPFLIVTIQATKFSRRSQNCPAYAFQKSSATRSSASPTFPPQQPSLATHPHNINVDKTVLNMASTEPSIHSSDVSDDDTLQETQSSLMVQQCIQKLREKGIKVVVFDMDLTIVNQHSRGRLKRGEPLEEFLSKVSPDFVQLVPALYKEGFQLAIATHSDEAEYNRRITPETHILGDELAKTVLKRHLDAPVADSFYIVAYNPYARKNPIRVYFGDWAKRHHMTLIQTHYQVKPEEMLMVDDTLPIIMDCQQKCGVQAIPVSPLTGFKMEDIIDNL